MNFQCSKPLIPLRIFLINTLTPTAQLVATKILSGLVFGKEQGIILTLLVYSNEVPDAEALKYELEKCAFSCTHSIRVYSDMPRISDADIFIFITDFPNPNFIDFDNIDTDEQFDTLYLLMKIASNFDWKTLALESKQDDVIEGIKKKSKEDKPVKKLKPLLIADGLVALNILHHFSQDVPYDVFYSPSPMTAIAKTILGDHLKVQCNFINDMLVWAANDEVFHVEVEKPMVLHERSTNGGPCDWNMIGKEFLESAELDHTQFSASWMKKEFIEKIKTTAAKNPYGSIYKASQLSRLLHSIWMSRTEGSGDREVCTSMGVISNGSIDTVKGCPYVLPIKLSSDSWIINQRFFEEPHVKLEIRRINKAMKEHQKKLIQYCKKFFKDQVLDQQFLAIEEEETISTSASASSPASEEVVV